MFKSSYNTYIIPPPQAVPLPLTREAYYLIISGVLFMVKFLGVNDGKLIFNYLDKNLSALFSCITEYYRDMPLENGAFAMQYINSSPVCLCAHGENFSLLFPSDKTDFEELSFSLKGEIHSPFALPFRKVGEYYLLSKNISPNMSVTFENTYSYKNLKAVIEMNGSSETVNLQYLFKKGYAVPFVFSENDEIFGGGLIVNSADYAVISHVFVKEEYRKKGFGVYIVKNLLKYNTADRIYLLSENSNLKFYGKLGFKPILTVNKYNADK